ncbi:hypothetical protein H0H93_010233 [Arthromyces matolae]|nr:hypothetical protein H0H93_010233 [Arthromyces matolae]
MSLLRAVSSTRTPVAASVLRRRAASSSAHDNHHHHDANEQYPREGQSIRPSTRLRPLNAGQIEFSGPFWRNTVISALLVAAFYKFAPEPTNETYLTRWMALYYTPRERLMQLAVKHTAMSADNSDATVLLGSARQPPVHRYRYPQSFEKSSPFLMPVGEAVDTA